MNNEKTPQGNHPYTNEEALSVAENLYLGLTGTGSGDAMDKGLTYDEYLSLSPKQQALCSEAGALCLGLRHGMISEGQPRIRDNLYEVIEQMPEAPSKSQQALIGKLSSAIRCAALYGLSVEGVAFHRAKNMDRFR